MNFEPSPELPPPDLATDNETSHLAKPVKARRSVFKTIMLVFLGLIVIGGIAAGGWYWYYFHASAFSPVELSSKEQLILNDKIELAGGDAVFVGAEALEPNDKPIVIRDSKELQAQREEDRRTIIFTEKEINAVLHHNTDLADKLYIDLKRDVIVAKVVYPVKEDVAIVGGKTLRANITMRIFLDENRQLQLTLDDLTVGGIPLPNAWLFDLKDKNLIELDGEPEGTGLLKRIADGIADFKIENGQIKIRLNE